MGRRLCVLYPGFSTCSNVIGPNRTQVWQAVLISVLHLGVSQMYALDGSPSTRSNSWEPVLKSSAESVGNRPDGNEREIARNGIFHRSSEQRLEIRWDGFVVE